jgi:phosphoribosylamine--glycine ligase
VKLLILGSGGREHALAWRLSRDREKHEIVVAPGNPGTAEVGRNVAVDLLSPDAVLELARREHVDLTIVGPEGPLEQGVADRFLKARLPLLGPTRAGAALECSKAYAKRLMDRLQIPTARFVVCDSLDSALDAVSGKAFGFPVVVKADGLAAGKGVTVATDRAEAEAAVRAAMVDGQFGDSGSRLVIEECLSGPEVSLFFLTDGGEVLLLGSAQDHKRIFDDDRGPNTGGMGAFAPSPLATDELVTGVMRRIVGPIVSDYRKNGENYSGFLYVSLMMTADGPKVIEFNVRFGDPEAQVVLPLLEGSLARHFWNASAGPLVDLDLRQSSDKAVGVVLASGGYPASSESGREITGLKEAEQIEGVTVFHAGTKMENGKFVTAGGRVLTVVAKRPTFEQAIEAAYQAVDKIHFEGMQFRRDIGRKALVKM